MPSYETEMLHCYFRQKHDSGGVLTFKQHFVKFMETFPPAQKARYTKCASKLALSLQLIHNTGVFTSEIPSKHIKVAGRILLKLILQKEDVTI